MTKTKAELEIANEATGDEGSAGPPT
jgi:hypothetical protein